jgi:hypothetical protein
VTIGYKCKNLFAMEIDLAIPCNKYFTKHNMIENFPIGPLPTESSYFEGIYTWFLFKNNF